GLRPQLREDRMMGFVEYIHRPAPIIRAAPQPLRSRASSLAAAAVIDPSDRETRTRRAQNGTEYAAGLRDGRANLPPFVQPVAAAQFRLDTLSTGRQVLRGNGSTTYMESEASWFGYASFPVTLLHWVRSEVAGVSESRQILQAGRGNAGENCWSLVIHNGEWVASNKIGRA